jgi:GT2 family glycosyltransferase
LPYTLPGLRPYLCTANLSVRREVIARSGCFEPGRSRAEDLDWTTRLRGLGYRLYFEPTALIQHNPVRYTPRAVWRHWVDDAPHTLRVRLRHARLMATPQLTRWRWPFLWLAPLIAAWATVRTFRHPRTLALYWHGLPLVYLTKLAWCWGAFWFYGQATREREEVHGTPCAQHHHYQLEA